MVDRNEIWSSFAKYQQNWVGVYSWRKRDTCNMLFVYVVYSVNHFSPFLLLSEMAGGATGSETQSLAASGPWLEGPLLGQNVPAGVASVVRVKRKLKQERMGVNASSYPHSCSPRFGGNSQSQQIFIGGSSCLLTKWGDTNKKTWSLKTLNINLYIGFGLTL